jgi:hypothetical protein
MTTIQNISAAAYGVMAYEPSLKTDGKKATPPKTSTVNHEQVELSDASITLNKLKKVVNELPEIRLQMVEDIKQRIKYNGYPIETSMYKAVEKLIADKIVA